MNGLATQEETKALTIIKHALQDAQIGREIDLSMKADTSLMESLMKLLPTTWHNRYRVSPEIIESLI